jgi:hypothetical protein
MEDNYNYNAKIITDTDKTLRKNDPILMLNNQSSLPVTTRYIHTYVDCLLRLDTKTHS